GEYQAIKPCSDGRPGRDRLGGCRPRGAGGRGAADRRQPRTDRVAPGSTPVKMVKSKAAYRRKALPDKEKPRASLFWEAEQFAVLLEARQEKREEGRL